MSADSRSPIIDAFGLHLYNLLGVPPQRLDETLLDGRIGLFDKTPSSGPVTIITRGAVHLPVQSGEPVELAVEVLEEQIGAAIVALGIVTEDMSRNRRVPPTGVPWRNDRPFLTGTNISAIIVTPSRYGTAFDDVRTPDGAVVGHVRTLRLLTDREAAYAQSHGWDALVSHVGSIDALLDVDRPSAVAASPPAKNAPAFVSKLHAKHPPRWVTYDNNALTSYVGLETDEYLRDSSNLEIWSVETFVARFPFVAGFVENAQPGQTALFTDASGRYTLEAD